MMTIFISFICGFIFSVGLAISGMLQPQNVLAFLDIFRSWNPSLAFVMVGAIITSAMGYLFIRKISKPLLNNKFHTPNKVYIDKKLIFGSIIFGIGWGLAGYCPGPAIASLGTATENILIYVFSMIIGIVLFKASQKIIS